MGNNIIQLCENNNSIIQKSVVFITNIFSNNNHKPIYKTVKLQLEEQYKNSYFFLSKEQRRQI